MDVTNAKTVFVGLSGGVDSSVAALRLKEQGYNVVGVFIKVWHPDWMVCNWEAERLDAMRVAAHLDIPFLTCDATAEYKQEVADYFISEYIAGRTPNPDVMCNKAVKFGAFLRFAKEREADFIATGHYAQKGTENETPSLLRGVDTNKDQSYFLWTLTSEQLQSVLLPVGDTEKPEIRAEAEKAGIATATKKDSQGVCFLGHVDIPEFLSHYTELTSGDVLNENKEVVGEHKGALVYTLGQRHGFTIHSSTNATDAHYVVAKDLSLNTITVATAPPAIATKSTITLSSTVLREALQEGDQCEVQFRYRQKPLSATLIKVSEDTIELQPMEEAEQPSAGQSCVLYRGNVCLGGGIIG